MTYTATLGAGGWEVTPIRSRAPGGTVRGNRLLTVMCGNSIPGYNTYTFADKLFASTSELHYANQLAGAPMLFREITEGTRVDAYGTHSFGGALCPAIIADITTATTGWLALLRAGGTAPDMVCIPDAIVNDIAADVSAANCISRLSQLINVIRATYPEAIIWLSTIRGSATFTPGSARRIVAEQVCNWIMAQDNGRNTFSTELRGVWGDMGAGVSQFTPDGVHPNPRGAMAVGRRMAETLRRISAGHCGNVAINSSPSLLGSATASGTGVSGTWPTGASHAPQAGPSTVQITALNPGVRLTYTLTGEADLGTIQVPGTVPDVDLPFGTRVAAAYRVRLISGAAFLRNVRPELRLFYTAATGGTNDFRYGMRFESGFNAVYPIYQDGDVLDLTLPACFGTSPRAIANPVPFLRFNVVGGNTLTAEVDYMGVSILS
jgi:hypothetical protein